MLLSLLLKLHGAIPLCCCVFAFRLRPRPCLGCSSRPGVATAGLIRSQYLPPPCRSSLTLRSCLLLRRHPRRGLALLACPVRLLAAAAAAANPDVFCGSCCADPVLLWLWSPLILSPLRVVGPVPLLSLRPRCVLLSAASRLNSLARLLASSLVPEPAASREGPLLFLSPELLLSCASAPMPWLRPRPCLGYS